MLVINEIQKNNDTTNILTEYFTDVSRAKSRYHQLLAIAAVSTVPEHSVILISEEGNWMYHEKYIHELEQEGNTNE